MAWLALGALALLLGLWLLRAFAEASPAAIRQAALWLLALLGGGLLLLLLMTGRGAQALWALVFFGPILWRRFNAWAAARRFARPAEDASTVETATLAMQLDHATGTLTGRILRGPQAGRDLASLDLAALVALLEDCRSADPESIALLETWLDRTHPGWRDAPSQPSGGPMTRAEALAILGLAEGADAEAIRAAHRRLMRSAHPDRGGSDWLAARINQARDILLG
jgi:DnaJ-domain-containing protein 1